MVRDTTVKRKVAGSYNIPALSLLADVGMLGKSRGWIKIGEGSQEGCTSEKSAAPNLYLPLTHGSVQSANIWLKTNDKDP